MFRSSIRSIRPFPASSFLQLQGPVFAPNVNNLPVRPLSTSPQTLAPDEKSLKRLRKTTLAHYKQSELKRVSKKESQHVPVYNLPQRHPMTKEQIINIAVWLRQNLPIRLAKMIMKFQGLPFSLAIRDDILEAHDKYIESFTNISLFPKLEGKTTEQTWDNVISFTQALDDALDNHKDTLPLLIKGFSDLTIESRKQEAQDFMNELISDRLSIRLICNHQVEIVNEFENRSNSQRPISFGGSGYNTGLSNSLDSNNGRFVGIFDKKFNPVKLVEQLYAEQQEVCIAMFGPNVPELALTFVETDDSPVNSNNQRKNRNKANGNSFNKAASVSAYNFSSFSHNRKSTLSKTGTEFTYIPHALEYILKEILKNSLRAQIKAHEKTFGINSVQKHQPIKVAVVCNKYDFIIKISDKGHGVKHEQVEKIWMYHMTTGDEDEESSSFFDMVGGQRSANDKALYGYGCGLPISKVYAERMGGSLKMETVQGYGTDVYIKMPYLENERKVGQERGIYGTLKL